MFLIVAGLNAAVAIYSTLWLPEFLLRFVAFVLARVMYRVEVRGHENLPESGGVASCAITSASVDFMIIAAASAVRRAS